MANDIRKVLKTEEKNKTKENLYKELVDNFTTSFKNLVDTKIDLATTKITRKSIAQDLEISEQALQNYESDRIVSNQLLAAIRNYFDVPYSTLFGEITSKDINNAKKELAIGLNEKALKKMEKMQHQALNDNYSTNYEDKFKIFLINTIICDDDLINQLSATFSYYLGYLELKKRMENQNFKFKNREEDLYLMNLYRFFSTIEKRFENLSNSKEVTPQIRKLAYKVAKKYAGIYQNYLN